MLEVDFSQYGDMYAEIGQAFEELPLDKKNVLLLYAELRSVAKLSKVLGVSPSIGQRLLKEAREAVLDRYELLRDN